MEKQQFEIVTAESSIEWTGKKVTGVHNGTIAVQAGSLTLTDGRLTGGRFLIDTRSIKILDISDPVTNAQFAGHLASDDFFSSEKYPEAILEITSVSGAHIDGLLTIKNITQPIGFYALVTISGNTLTAAAKMIIDRTKYDMKFRSGNFFTNLGDTLIYNDFELNINITAQIVQQTVLA